MLDEGDTPPDFTAPMATPEAAAEAERGAYTSDDVTRFWLTGALSDGPVVLAFYPGAWSRTCTRELCQVRDWRGDLAAEEADVYGVSVDTPWSLLAFVDEYDLNYPLISGFNNEIVADYGLRREEGVLAGIANRAVVVVAPDRTVTYAWETRESLDFPDLDAVAAAVRDA